jgi:hypothetical protein
MAATGFQRGSNSLSDIQEMFLGVMNSEDKSFIFLRTRLRSGLELYKEGGHVTMKYSDQAFRLMFDNKRIIIDNDPNQTLYDSKPLTNVGEGDLIRYIAKLPKSKQYVKTSCFLSGNSYKNKKDLIIRNFIKALVNNKLNLDYNNFSCYKDIVDYIKLFDKDITISENYISQLKRRGNIVKTP